jgi:hypothetical protein
MKDSISKWISFRGEGHVLLSKFELCWPTKFLSRKSTAMLLEKAKNILRYLKLMNRLTNGYPIYLI